MKKLTHTGCLIADSRRPRIPEIQINLMETETHWINKLGIKFKKSDGLVPGDPLELFRLDLDTIKEIEK